MRLLDRLTAMWLLPPLGFLITVVQLPILRYLITNYVIMIVLIAAVAGRLMSWSVRGRVLHLMLMAMVLAVALGCIEWAHYLAGRKTIDGLIDVRMVIYSPFYGSVLIFVLYSIYLTILSPKEKLSHLRFVIRYLTVFHFIFIIYWLLLYAGWVDVIPRTALLHSNSIAYSALFVLIVGYYYRDDIKLSKLACIGICVINLLVILLNHTRGAIIGLGMVALVEVLWYVGGRCQRLVLFALISSLACLLIYGHVGHPDDDLLGTVLGRDAGTLPLLIEEVVYAYERGESVVELGPSAVSDERALSAFSRIGSNYYSLLSFLDNPYFGIGQAESYSIEVIGSGVHSFHFLLANATGTFGMLLFLASLVAALVAQGSIVLSRRFVMLVMICFGHVLIFENSIPVYFSLIVAVLSNLGKFKINCTVDEATTKCKSETGCAIVLSDINHGVV